MRKKSHIIVVYYVLIISLFSLPLSASIEPSVFIRAASNSIYNGVSENADQAIIAINAELQINYYLTTGIQLQNARKDTSQRNRNFSSYIGYDKKISTNWLSSTYFTHRAFPGSEREWDYDEISSRLSHSKGLSLGLTYSPNYYSSSVKAIKSTIAYSRHLVKNSYFKTEVGNVNIPTLSSYQFIEATIGARYQRFNFELGYHWVNDTLLSTSVGNIASPKFILSVSYFAF